MLLPSHTRLDSAEPRFRDEGESDVAVWIRMEGQRGPRAGEKTHNAEKNSSKEMANDAGLTNYVIYAPTVCGCSALVSQRLPRVCV